MSPVRSDLLVAPSALRAALAFGLIWLALLAVPAARAAVAGQLSLLPGALRRQLPAGALAGVALVAFDVWLLRLWGGVRVDGWRSPAPWLLLANLLFVGFLALTEEMVFRGVLFGRLEAAAGGAAAVLITAALFCLFHFVGRRLDWQQGLGYLLDGLLLGGLVWWTRDLWAAVGWHAAKNLAVTETFGGTYRIKEPLLRLTEVPRLSRAVTAAADLLAFALSAALCLGLLWLARRSRHG
jgi:membrane protease YdiL (CAAX protease family)